MTKSEAIAEINDLADYCENENYHTEAGMLWDLIPVVEAAVDKMVILVCGPDGINKFEVNP